MAETVISLRTFHVNGSRRLIAEPPSCATLSAVETPIPSARVRMPDPLKISVDRLVREGAIVSIGAEPSLRMLLGELRWVQPGKVFLFAAHGDGVADARIVQFDDITVAEPGRMHFCSGNTVVAKLDRIALSDVEDPSDYQVAWQLWEQVAPLRRALIDDCAELLASDTSDVPDWTEPLCSEH